MNELKNGLLHITLFVSLFCRLFWILFREFCIVICLVIILKSSMLLLLCAKEKNTGLVLITSFFLKNRKTHLCATFAMIYSKRSNHLPTYGAFSQKKILPFDTKERWWQKNPAYKVKIHLSVDVQRTMKLVQRQHGNLYINSLVAGKLIINFLLKGETCRFY